MFRYKCTVNRVIDGDTVDLDVDLGFYMQVKIRVRLLGVDAPETRTKDAEEKVRGLNVKMLLEEFLADCDELFIETEKTGKFGRWLGTIWTADNVSINDLVGKWSEVEVSTIP